MSMLKKILFIVISLSLFSLTKLPSNGYCDDWDYLGGNEDFTDYYNSSSVKIDKQKKIIEVWVKRVTTDKGKIDFLSNFEGIEKQKYIDINHRFILYYLNYKELKFSINHITHYSKSDNVLSDDKRPSKWVDIKSNSIGDVLLNKILKENNIQR